MTLHTKSFNLEWNLVFDNRLIPLYDSFGERVFSWVTDSFLLAMRSYFGTFFCKLHPKEGFMFFLMAGACKFGRTMQRTSGGNHKIEVQQYIFVVTNRF